MPTKILKDEQGRFLDHVSELQDTRLDDLAPTPRRLHLAEDQLAALIESRRGDHAYDLVRDQRFRFWIGVLAGHDTEFLQQALTG